MKLHFYHVSCPSALLPSLPSFSQPLGQHLLPSFFLAPFGAEARALPALSPEIQMVTEPSR
jgi:hypothetical protein